MRQTEAGTNKQGILGVVLLVSLATPGWVPEVQAADRPMIFRVATASKAGTFYPIGSLIARGISDAPKGTQCQSQIGCGVPNLLAVVQVSNGSVANVEAISGGRIEAGLAQADVVYWAHSGTGRFAKKGRLTGLTVIANLYPGSLHIVASAASGLNQVRDLVGQRVALDEPGSGTLATAEMILASEGISKADLRALYIKHIHAGPMLAEDQLDAFFFVAGFPTRSVIDVSKRIGIKLVPLSEKTIKALVRDRPYFARGIIPKGTYSRVTSDVATVDIGTQLVVREDLEEELVYRITAELWSKRTRRLLDEGHPKGKQVKLETALRGVAVPLHPGADRYYRDAGLLKR